MAGVIPLSVEELRQRYGTIIPDGYEMVKWPLYDTQVYAMAGQVVLNYFNTVGVDPDRSNMETASSIPAPKKYFLRGIGLHAVPLNGSQAISQAAATAGTTVGTRANDIEAIFNHGNLQLLIGNKQYLFGAPLGMFPSPVTLDGFAAVHFTQAMAADRTNIMNQLQNSKGHRDIFLLDPPLLIESQINFSLQLRWTTAFAISATCDLKAIFMGQMIRPMQ